MPDRAMLVILAGVRPEHELDFNLWYDREHLPDRIGVPGFQNARRYRADGEALWPYLALYEADRIDAFRSEEYRRRLANQSDWSRRVLPTFVDPQRTIAAERAKAGTGFGPTTALLALRPRAGAAADLAAAVARLGERMLERDEATVAVTLLASDPELSKPVAEYPAVASSPIRGDDWLLFVDHAGDLSLPSLSAGLRDLPLAEDPLAVGRYRLRSAVTPADALA